ncbi:folliculin [Nomia melanderi]|uniref:folliculin n=1 Tax=Nomia melanderi TaxID=2448451 RepID=UPI0013047554|nr:uncharacterized protein LOC116424363 [Nomia melanderi]
MVESIVEKDLLGIAAAHNGLIVLKNCQAILRRDYTNMIGKVKLVSGSSGKSELPCSEFVGPGMLTAAVLGNTFSAPRKNNILKVIEEIGSNDSSGILLIVPDYDAYPINFTWAKLCAVEKGYNVKIILVTTKWESVTEEQSFLCTHFLYKIAGAMSEEGKHIDQIYFFCNHLINSGQLHLLKTNTAEHIFDPLINTLNIMPQDKYNKNSYDRNRFHTDQEVAIIINNIGSTHSEMYTFILDILKQMEMHSLQAKRIYIKSLLTSSNIKYFNMCVLNLSLSTILIKCLDFPTSAPGWPKILTSDMLGMMEDGKLNLCTSGKYCQNDNTENINLQGPLMRHESGKKLLSIISTACEATVACTNQLNKLDQECGKGDYGTNLAYGAQAINNAIQDNKIFSVNPCVTFMQISHIIEKSVDGIQGTLYSLFFNNISKAFSKYESDEQITVDMWSNILITANRGIIELGVPHIDDQILVAVLINVQFHFTKALNDNRDPMTAFGMAVKAAENFSINNKLKYPCPEAHAVGIWMRGAYECTKRGQNILEDGQYECEGCQSIGNVKYLSNEHETKTSFLSAQQSLTQDIWCLLKHACFRSLSCEVHPGREGVCYFGDEYRGHVLSHTFTLKDAQARGFRRWCSFIVFMRDKQFLLNMWPFLVDNLKEVIRELQDFAEKKYNAEEAECPQRIVRLTTVTNGSGSYKNSHKLPRSFYEITNEKHVFIRIHMWLVWILSAGARHFIEIFPMSLLDDELNYDLEHQIETEEGFTLVNAKLPVNLNLNSNESETNSEFSEVSEKSTTVILRDLRSILGKDQFRQLLYSSLTGVQILVRGPSIETLESLYGLSSLIPCACRRVKTQATEYMDPNKCNFIGVDTSVAVPLPCANVCRLDIISEEHKIENTNSHIVRWTGTLPLKLPTLLTKIEKSLDNEKLGNSTLKAHFAALQEEWANIAKVIHAMRGRGHSEDLSGLMLSLGAGPHDKKLLDAWSMGLPPNPA